MQKIFTAFIILFLLGPLFGLTSVSVWCQDAVLDAGNAADLQQMLQQKGGLQSLPSDIRSQIEQIQEDRLSQTDQSPDTDVEADKDAESELVDEDIEASDKDTVSRRKTDAPSKIEALYRTNYASSMAASLRQFGYNIFRSASLRAPRMAVPDDSYVIGPGDSIIIRFWGSGVGGEYTETVAPDGTISIPQLGVVPVAGLNFSQLTPTIRNEAEKYIQGINLHVSLKELRSVEIYVVGAVDNPGLHVVPAFSTVMGGLLAAGGVNKTGSLRQIELIRGKKRHLKMDLYDLLLEGSRKFDVTLEDQDVIFVPRIGETIAIAGAVKDEAIFEVAGSKTIGDLLELAGGVLPQAFTGRIYLRRYQRNREFLIEDIDTLTTQKKWRSIPLKNGDLLEVQFMSPSRPKVVRLEGNVSMPDVFRYEPGLSLSDILTSKSLLAPGSILEFGHLYRYDPQTTRTTIKEFPLEKVLNGTYDAPLQPYDRIVVLSREQMNIVEEVSIHGAVWRPGKYPYRPDTTLRDMIARAGGTRFGANVHRIEVSRQHIKEDKVFTTHMSLDLDLNDGLVLQPFDYIIVPTVKEARLIKTVAISGEVRFPGQYRIKDGEKVSDLIERAGGFTEHAYFYGAKYTSERARQIQQQSINRMIQNLQVEAQRTLSAEAQTALAKEDVQAAQAAQTTVQNLLARLRAVKAEGRVSIVLKELDAFRNTQYDFVMENGDELTIPRRPNFVAVVGGVYSPSAYLWENDRPLEYYLEKSGGPTRTADDKRMYVIKANGEVFSRVQTSNFENIRLMAGDTIVVPEDVERLPVLRLIKDLTDIVFKIAVTVGVLIAVF